MVVLSVFNVLLIIGGIILGLLLIGLILNLILNLIGRLGRFPIVAPLVGIGIGIWVGIASHGWFWGLLAGLFAAGLILWFAKLTNP